MPRSLSIIIPVLNESESLPLTLPELRSRFPGAELLVVDAASSDNTAVIAAGLADRVLQAPRGRARQMNAGAAGADGDFLLFLHADSMPCYGEVEFSEVLAASPDWGFAPLRLSGSRWQFRVIERAISLRSRLTRVATGDQGLFVRRALFEEEAGYADIPLMEDVELSKRLRKRAKPSVLPWTMTTSSRRWETRGVLRTIVAMWCLRLAYVLGVPPERLHRYYYG